MSPEEQVHRIANANYRAALARYDADIQTSLEATKAGNKAASDALKAVTLLNGGAAVAMLAFIGHLASIQVDQSILGPLKEALFEFVGGTFLSVIATALTYFVQEGWITVLNCKFRKRELEEATPPDREAIRKGEKTEKRWRRGVGTLRLVATCSGLLALAAFGFASYTAYGAFEKLSTKQSIIAAAKIHQGCQAVGL